MNHTAAWRSQCALRLSPGGSIVFAALNILDGTVIGGTMPRHRHQKWLRFLKQVVRSVPKDMEIHVICDNCATQKHKKVQAWLKGQKRVHIHFTPTSASCLNMVERLFRDITKNRIRRGVFRSVQELEQAIRDDLAHHNAAPKRFAWKTNHPDILGKVARAKAALNGSDNPMARH